MMKGKIYWIILGLVSIIAVVSIVWISLIRLPKVSLVAEDPILKAIKTRGKIMVGTDATYPPMESIDEAGNFIGLDIEVAKEIASDLGTKAEFRNIPWEELISFEPLFRGDVDMLISSITITPERAEKVAFSDPYFNAGQVIVTTFDKAETIKGVKDLAGKKLGVQRETTSEKEAKKYTDPELVIGFENYALAKEALLTGGIDAIIIDYPAGVGMVSKEPTFRIIGEPLTQEFYGIAVKKEARGFLAEINKTIRRLKREGVIEKLMMKWFTE